MMCNDSFDSRKMSANSRNFIGILGCFLLSGTCKICLYLELKICFSLKILNIGFSLGKVRIYML